MSISKKIYSTVLRIKEVTSRKSFQFSFMFFITIFFFFGTFNIYAAADDDEEGEMLKVTPAWEETKWYHNLASGLLDGNKGEDNMNSRNGTEMLNSGWTLVSLLTPEITDYEASAGDGIPYDLKRGLLGMTEDAGTAIYASYPMVNIPAHLAYQWVPGYQENVNSLYAANSSTGHPSGYEELVNSGVVTLWTRTLNLSYIFFVLVMIASGFMIMFRHKIGGQAMVTLGTVLPKVITSLIIATFSFAIAGFIIDIGGVITGVLAYVLVENGDLLSISGIGSLMSSVLGQSETGVGGLFLGVAQIFGLGDLFQNMSSGTPVGLLAIVVALVAFIISPVGTVVVGAIALFVIIAILGIILFGAIKVLIALYKAYFTLLIAVILGPIQITLGAIPGNSKMVKNWLLTILRNVLVFPVVFFIVNLPNALAASGTDILLRFPGKLVYEDPTTYSTDGVSSGGIFNAILRIFALYFAAQAPKFLEAWLPADNSKAIGEGIGAAKANLSKIPLVGSMFK